MAHQKTPNQQLSSGAQIDTCAFIEGQAAYKHNQETTEMLQNPYDKEKETDFWESFNIGWNSKAGINGGAGA